MVSISVFFSLLLAVNAVPVLERRDGDGSIASQLRGVYMLEEVVEALYEYSPTNIVLSQIWAPKVGSQAAAPAFYDLLNANNAPVPAVDASEQNNDANAPTIDQLMQASLAVENTTFYTVPSVPSDSGLKPYNVPGSNKQLSAYDTATGMNARVFASENDKIIIAFSGFQIKNLPTDLGSLVQDEGSVSGMVNEGQKNAAAFCRLIYMVARGGKRSISDIYVTGHSTGAGEAEYVGWQFGFGGVAFEGTGLPQNSSATGNGTNFISFVNYGDVWGSYASDVSNNPLDVIGGPKADTLPHYGRLIMAGNETNAEIQRKALSAFKSSKYIPLGEDLVFLADFIVETNFPTHLHNPNDQGAIDKYLNKRVGEVV